MILLKSLIVLLLLIIIAHFMKTGWFTRLWNKELDRDREGFKNLAVDEVNSYYDINIADDLRGDFSPHVPAMQNTVQLPPQLGGELAPAIGSGKLAPSQRIQGEARDNQQREETETIGNHKEVSDNALDMNYLKGEMDELVKLSNEAKIISENFKSIAR
jgi:hypothetical protein